MGPKTVVEYKPARHASQVDPLSYKFMHCFRPRREATMANKYHKGSWDTNKKGNVKKPPSLESIPPHGKIAPIKDMDHKRQAESDDGAPTPHNSQVATKHPAGRNASRPQALVSLWSLIFNVGYSMSKVKGQRKQVNVKKWIFFMKCEG